MIVEAALGWNSFDYNDDDDDDDDDDL